MPAGRLLPRSFFAQDAWVVAPLLLNKLLVAGDRAVRLVEVEAYAWFDPASHSYGGVRPRNAVMYGPPARLYVYFSYGMHWCANVVVGPDGSGQAVLLRAGEPITGVEAMTAARGGHGGRHGRDLCRGPARLAQALGLGPQDNGRPLGGGAPAGVAIRDDGVAPPALPAVGPRVGITKAADVPWRWWVPGSPWVSGGRERGGGATAGG